MAEVTLLLAFVAGLISFLNPCVLPLVPGYFTFLAGATPEKLQENDPKTRARIFFSSVLFVLGFALVFSIMGVALQGILSSIAFDAQKILGYVGGALLIFFGIVLTGLVKIPFLQTEHKLRVKAEKSSYTTSFFFGAAFAAGWTPCAGAILAGVLTLAVTEPLSAFPLMLSYSLGMGLPFLLVGAFISRSRKAITVVMPYLQRLNIAFGIILIILGILVFTGTLSVVANALFPRGIIPEIM